MKSNIALLLLVCSACGANTEPTTGSKTNWLANCTRDVECAELPDAICEGWQCTKVCTLDDDCEPLGTDLHCDQSKGVCLGVKASEFEKPQSESDASTASVALTATSAVVTTQALSTNDAVTREFVSDAGQATAASVVEQTSGPEVTGSVTLYDAGATETDSITSDPPPDEMPEIPDTRGCEPNYIDPLQGNPTPLEADCPSIGLELQQGHDAALQGVDVDVAPLAGTWVDDTGGQKIEPILDVEGKGTLRFGDASDYPTPSASELAFLSDVGERDADQVGAEVHFRPQPGFGYSVIAEAGQGSEMSFHILTVQAWDSWCALQEPVYSPFTSRCYACIEVAETFSFYPAACGEQEGCFASLLDPAEESRVHCGRMELCGMPYSNACSCTADACFANVTMSGQQNFYPYEVQLDPVDTSILRLRNLSEFTNKETFTWNARRPED